jgi:tripartite-type tricarboxylate transporter receptor subunit TctC
MATSCWCRLTFALSAGIQLNHIPYRSTAPVVQDLLGGRVQAAVLPIAIAMPLARNGQLRILATTAPVRWPELPEVPTMEEAGLGAATVVIQ